VVDRLATRRRGVAVVAVEDSLVDVPLTVGWTAVVVRLAIAPNRRQGEERATER